MMKRALPTLGEALAFGVVFAVVYELALHVLCTLLGEQELHELLGER